MSGSAAPDHTEPAKGVFASLRSLGLLERFVLGAIGVTWLTLGTRVMAAGVGADNDTWLMLGTWEVMTHSATYVPSRFQGYPLAEVTIGAFNDLGGHWLAGVASLAAGVVCLGMLAELLSRRPCPRQVVVLLTALLAATPVFIIAATTSVDYLYGLALFLVSWSLIEREIGGPKVGVLLGLATAARISYLPLGLLLVLAGPNMSKRSRGRTLAWMIPTSVLAYLPGLVWAGGDPSKLIGVDRPTSQGFAGVAGRAVFKGVDLIGIPAFVIIAVLLIRFAWRHRSAIQPGPLLRDWKIIAVAFQLVLWALVPAEPSYLLPLIPFGLVIAAEHANVTRRSTTLLCCVVLAVLVQNWLAIRPYEVVYRSEYTWPTCQITEASTIKLSFVAQRGDLLGYPHLEDERLKCNEQILHDFVLRWGEPTQGNPSGDVTKAG